MSTALLVAIADEVVSLINGSPMGSGVITGATTLNSATITAVPETRFLTVGQKISGAGIPVGATIIGIVNDTSFNISAPATATATGVTITPAAMFTAKRRYAPVVDRKLLSSLTCSVVPAKQQSRPLSRASWEGDYEIDVALQVGIEDQNSNDQVDPNAWLLEQIEAYCLSNDHNGNSRRILPLTGGKLTDVQVKTLCDPKHLREFQVMTAVLTLTYYRATVTT